MVWAGKTDAMMRVYAFSMLIYVLALANITWLDFLSYSYIIKLYIIAVCIIKITSRHVVVKKKLVTPLYFLLFFCFYFCFVLASTYQIVSYLALSFSILSIVLLRNSEKKYLLNVIINGFIVILVISLFGWILFLMGVKLPHSDLIYHRNGYHEYYDYYFFSTSYNSIFALFPRFSSVFLEPGQLATPCAFLFYLNTLNNKILSFKNIVLLIAIILSFSLIAYGLLLISLVSVSWFKGYRYRLPLMFSVVLVIASITMYFMVNKNSVVNQLIIERLAYDEEDIIVGNNRYSSYFDEKYDSFIRSDDRYFGIKNQLVGDNDWTRNSSGHKKYIVHFGLCGLLFSGLLLFSFFWNNRSIKTFIFLTILVTAFIVRNLLFSPLWLSIAVLGFYTIDGVKRFDKMSS